MKPAAPLLSYPASCSFSISHFSTSDSCDQPPAASGPKRRGRSLLAAARRRLCSSKKGHRQETRPAIKSITCSLFSSTFQYASSTNCAHEACCTRISCARRLERSRRTNQTHANLRRRLIRLPRIARGAGADEVLPAMSPPPREQRDPRGRVKARSSENAFHSTGTCWRRGGRCSAG